jgi:malonyl-CoA O-methyltransferase
VADVGARVVVTDFHPRAYAAGHRRTFRDQDGVHEVEHYVHEAETHIAAAREAGLILVSTREAAIGPGALPFYEAAGRTAAYAEHAGLPVVLAFAFAREA